MNHLLAQCNVLETLETLCVGNIKQYEIYKQRALAEPNRPELSELAHYFQGRYDAYCLARNILAEAVRESNP